MARDQTEHRPDGEALSERALEAARQLGLSSGGPGLVPLASMFPRYGGSHFLVLAGQDHVHLWVPEDGATSWSDPAPESLSALVRGQMRCLRERLVTEGRGGQTLVYQPMGTLQTAGHGVEPPAGTLSFIAEEGNRVIIRTEDGTSRTIMEYLTRPEPDMRSTFILSRLNSKGLRSVPDLLGTSFWSRGDEQRPWLKVVRVPKGTGPAMSPFLSDLNDLTSRFMALDGEGAKRFMMELISTERASSLSAAFRLGFSIGELHGRVLLSKEEAASIRGDGKGSELAEMFVPGIMGMEQIGSLVGCYSSCGSAVRKGLTRLLGDPEPTNPSGQRKLKVIRKKGRTLRGEGMELLTMLRWHLLRDTERLRSLVMGIKSLAGAPTVISGLDPRLDRVEMSAEGQFIFKRFDFNLQKVQGRTDGRTTALKDLSLVLNSFMKVRFLCASSLLRRASIALGVPSHELETVLLDYNMAKRGHRAMVPDLTVWSRIGTREAVFRYTFAASVIGSIWYEKARNQLVSGYNTGVAMANREELLRYPGKVDTVECMRSVQCILALSSASDALSHPDGPRSSVGLSNDLFTALLV